ncbi:MAG TPA: hypothetical protein P5084_14720 [Paludibacter sp.]|nr:hypothetical protein [Paludibacter sp.]
MTPFNFEIADNMGGVCRIFAIPPSSFVRVWTDHVNNINYLTVRNREDIIDIYSIDEETEFTEDYESGIYSPVLSGITPGGRDKVNVKNTENLEKLDSGYWRLLFEDNNGFVRLAGTEDNMLTFRRTTTTGKLGERNQIEFAFSGKQLREAYYIELSDIDTI